MPRKTIHTKRSQSLKLMVYQSYDMIQEIEARVLMEKKRKTELNNQRLSQNLRRN